MKAMDAEEKDLVVSSEFATTLFSIQEHVPLAFQGTAHSQKASYARFRRYFKNNAFDSSDEKEQVIIIPQWTNKFGFVHLVLRFERFFRSLLDWWWNGRLLHRWRNACGCCM